MSAANQTSKHVAIIGSGSASFAAALKLAELGARVTMVENADVIGGTCVNIGCVPSKIMIRAALLAHQQSLTSIKGIKPRAPVVDRELMVQQQQSIVVELRHAKYENILLNTPAVNLIKGYARFINNKTLLVSRSDGTSIKIEADQYLLAVGARANIPAIAGLADTPFWTSTEALVATRVPDHLVVLGGSVVALELAQAFRRLGAKVTLMARSRLLSSKDVDLGEGLKTALEDEGMIIHLNTVPSDIRHDGKQFRLSIAGGEVLCDQLLVATGRRSNADTLALDNTTVKISETGAIIVDKFMRTSAEHIYAAGDCCNQPQYVYVAAAAGTRAARTIMGDKTALDLSAMPAVVFTDPQLATVGLDLAMAQSRGISVVSKTLTLDNVPRAIANLNTRGFIRLVAETDTGRILGCQVLAQEAGEIIQTAALAIRNQMTITMLADMLFPYLTMVEGLKLCAQSFSKDVSKFSCCAG